MQALGAKRALKAQIWHPHKITQITSAPDTHRISMNFIRSATDAPPPKPPAPPKTRPAPQDDGVVVLERRTQKVKPPQMYQVVLLNDDYTPMEFVVVVIQEFFGKDREQATQIMLKIHIEGKGVCGVYSRDVANTKVDQVMEAAKKAGHPLQCLAEPVN
jgi:ATP-dependent Clp protease adaptor protein ClpS